MNKTENTRGAMPLRLLIQFWKGKLGDDDPLNPPNPLGEVIQDTIFYLERCEGYEGWARSVNEALNRGDGTYRP